jgi:hypothetical protein
MCCVCIIISDDAFSHTKTGGEMQDCLTRINLELPASMKADLQACAMREQRTVNDLIRELLEAGLSRQKKKAARSGERESVRETRCAPKMRYAETRSQSHSPPEDIGSHASAWRPNS